MCSKRAPREAGYQMCAMGRARTGSWPESSSLRCAVAWRSVTTLLLANPMNCLRTLLLVTGLWATAPLLHAAGTPAATFGHPIVGTWSWVTFGGRCTETWQFRHNRTMLATSGGEVAEKTYEIAEAPDASGFYRLVETVVRQNDKPDCAGATLEGPGEQSTRFIQFSPQGDKLLVCSTAALSACFGPLKRVP